MKKTIGLMMLLAGGMFAAPRVSVGIGFGTPVPVVRPICPGPGYTWVEGYYGSNGAFVNGYWAPPVVQIAPRYDDRYRAFDRDHGRMIDRDHDREFDRSHDRFRR